MTKKKSVIEMYDGNPMPEKIEQLKIITCEAAKEMAPLIENYNNLLIGDPKRKHIYDKMIGLYYQALFD